MTKEQKLALIEEAMKSGDKRSYNELKADLELAIWRAKMQGILKPIIKKF